MSQHQKYSDNSKGREIAVQALFALTQPEHAMSIQDAVELALEAGHFPDKGYEDNLKSDYYLPLIQGVLDHLPQIDAKISPYLRNWEIDNIARIDATILRVAFYEWFFSTSPQPKKVIINEAIELTKFFSNDTSRKFVNGVLNQLLKDEMKNNTAE